MRRAGPGAGQRGLTAVDAWLEDRRWPKIPAKSPPAERIKEIPANQQVKGLVASGVCLSVKCKEAARGWL